MKRTTLALLFFFAALPVFAQDFTTVTGTVEDSVGIPYALGTITAKLVIAGNPVFTDTKLPYAPPTGLVKLDNNGFFTMQLAANGALTPASSTWTFVVCSVTGTEQPVFGKASSCYQVTGITISGSSQDISVALQNNAQPLTYAGSIILQDSPANCANLFGPVDPDFVDLDSTNKTTAASSAINSTAVIGVAVSVPASGCLGPVQVATSLVVPCVTSNFSTVGHWVAQDSATRGECKDIGASQTAGSIGQIMRANTGVGTISMVLLLPRGGSGGTGLGNCATSASGDLAAANGAGGLNCDPNSLTDFLGDLSSQSYDAVGAQNGEVSVTASGTLPSLALPLHTVSWLAPNSIPTSFRINVPSSAGSVGQVLSEQSQSTDSTGTLNVFTAWTSQSGSGTVTSFSAGNLSPLFTTSVATPTSTPALSFTLSNAAAHTFFGNNTGSTTAPAFVVITDADLPAAAVLKTCMIPIGAENGAALANADLGPQNNQCKISAASTIQEITLAVSNASSTTSVQVRKRHCSTFTSGSCTAFTLTNLLSAALAAASTADADACAKTTTSATCIDGTTSSGTVTVTTTAIAAGDYLEMASGTADGTTTRASISITYSVN
jgi:hypothetical protein